MAATSPGKSGTFCSIICNPRILLTFGVPLLAPSVILTTIGFVGFTDFGIIHIGGIVLLVISTVCVIFGILFLTCSKRKIRMQLLQEHRSESGESLEQPIPREKNKNRKKSKVQHVHKLPFKIQSVDSPRHTRKKRTNSRGVKDSQTKSSSKLATVTEDREDDKSRIISVDTVSRKSIETYHIVDIIGEPNELNSLRKSINVWHEQNEMVPAKSENSVISDSAIYIAQAFEMTPVEVLHETSCFQSFSSSPPRRSISLTNILKSSDTPESGFEQKRKRSGSVSNCIDQTTDIEGTNDSRCYREASSELIGVRQINCTH